jgi:hypothetical protein
VNWSRWFAVTIFFFFMLLHQSDKLLIGPLSLNIIDEFNITHTQFFFIFTAIIIPKDIALLREQLRQRALIEQSELHNIITG